MPCNLYGLDESSSNYTWTSLWWSLLMVYRFIPEVKKEHMSHLRIVLETLGDRQLFVKFIKCEFLLRSVHFLATLFSEGIMINPKKIEGVKNWPRPLSP